MAKRKWKMSELPAGSEKHWRTQFVPTAYRWIRTLERPWCLDNSLLCRVLQVIWNNIYDIPYEATVNGCIFDLVSLLTSICCILLTYSR